MKLVMAIVNDEDGNVVLSELNKNKFSVTKLATTGGFLKAGNMTLIIGTEDENVQKVIDIIKSKSKRRKQITASPMPIGASASFNPYPIEVEVGGVTIFVLDVDRFEKV
ncbi:MAG: cyclic-di-AMP receptor [Clostridia bacterium]|nr:cyclic-di-AMP receptor [Clostridia bacterium]